MTHSTPRFGPHVTLLTGIPTDAPLPQLLSDLNKAVAAYHLETPSEPFLPLQFVGLGTNHTFFQYVFAAVSQVNPQLFALRKAVRDGLLGDNLGEDDFFPHLSFVYGEDDDKKTAKGIIDELSAKGGSSVAGLDGFSAGEIQVVKCEGPPESWAIVGSVPLGVPV